MRSHTTALVELLEQRMHLSVTVKAVDSTLYIIGDNRNQIVQINDDQLPPNDVGTFVSVDADGDGSFNGPEDISGQKFTGIDHFVIQLRGGDDQLTFHVSSYVSASKTIVADLGNGNNTFSFGFGLSEFISDSHASVDLRTGSGNDSATLSLNDIKNHSVLDVHMDLGPGNDTLRTNFFGDVADASVLTVAAKLGQGNDTFSSNIDYESFDIMGAGQMTLDIDGGSGDDNLRVFAGDPEFGSTALIGGQLNILLDGGSGNDTIGVDLPSADFRGTVYLRANGGSGNDNLDVTLVAQPGNTPRFDVALLGGAGDDVLTANVSSDGTFGPRGAVLLDGGPGDDSCATSGNAPFILERC